MDLCNINEIKALLARHGFRFSKSMGQNFLIESWVPQDIAESSGAKEGYGVLEIGPGIGALTKELAMRADRVVSVELDQSLLPILKETMEPYPNSEIVSGDILKVDIPALVQEKFQGLTPIVCANLPYNITSPVLTALIESGCFHAITVMIQREVAQRICALPGTSEYGAFSVYCQYHTAPEILFDVPPECFLPAPKVTSSVLRMVPKEKPVEVDDEGDEPHERCQPKHDAEHHERDRPTLERTASHHAGAGQHAQKDPDAERDHTATLCRREQRQVGGGDVCIVVAVKQSHVPGCDHVHTRHDAKERARSPHESHNDVAPDRFHAAEDPGRSLPGIRDESAVEVHDGSEHECDAQHEEHNARDGKHALPVEADERDSDAEDDHTRPFSARERGQLLGRRRGVVVAME